MDPPQRDPAAPSASTARIVHRLYATASELSVKNRMLEIGTSGSVRGGDGNIPTYSALGSAQRRQIRRECRLVGETSVIAEELQAAGVVGCDEPLQE